MLKLEELARLIEIICDLREISRRLEYYNLEYAMRKLSPAEWAEVDKLEKAAEDAFSELKNYVNSDIALVFTNNPLTDAILICGHHLEIYI